MKHWKHKIHFIEKIDGRYRYLCIHAVEPTYEKSTKFQALITCKNCRKALK